MYRMIFAWVKWCNYWWVFVDTAQVNWLLHSVIPIGCYANKHTGALQRSKTTTLSVHWKKKKKKKWTAFYSYFLFLFLFLFFSLSLIIFLACLVMLPNMKYFMSHFFSLFLIFDCRPPLQPFYKRSFVQNIKFFFLYWLQGVTIWFNIFLLFIFSWILFLFNCIKIPWSMKKLFWWSSIQLDNINQLLSILTIMNWKIFSQRSFVILANTVSRTLSKM